MMVKNDLNLGHRKRLRNRFLKTSTTFEDYELLELMLSYVFTRIDTKPLAKELLVRFKTVRGVFDAKEAELMSIEGFGGSAYTFIRLFREIWFRYEESPLKQLNLFCHPNEVARVAMIRLQGLAHEESWVVLLDSQHRLIRWEKISEGTSNSTVVYPIKVTELAIANRASALILVHNHPSADSTPSVKDVTLTEKIRVSCDVVGIHLLDHLIVSESGCFSILHDRLL